MAKFAFKSDTQALRQWLGRRKTALESARTPHESIWKDLRLFFEPSYGKALLGENTADLAS